MDYLFYKEDLYGYSVFEIKTKRIFNYYPAASYYKGTETFIGTDIHYNKNSNIFAVGGCYWGSPMDTLLIRINNPLEEFIEYISIQEMFDKYSEEYEGIEYLEWQNNDIKFETYNIKSEKNEIIILKEEEYKNKMIRGQIKN